MTCAGSPRRVVETAASERLIYCSPRPATDGPTNQGGGPNHVWGTLPAAPDPAANGPAVAPGENTEVPFGSTPPPDATTPH